jgi:hypothetical protein
MKTRLLVLVLALGITPAFAGEYLSPQELAHETGLTTRQVGMVLGPHSAYAGDYLAGYSIVRDKFISAVGRSRYNDLVKQYRQRGPQPPPSLLAGTESRKESGS